jgi:hypothetical protein
MPQPLKRDVDGETSPPGMILVGIEASDGVMLGSNPKTRKQPMNRAGFIALEMFKQVAVIER